nr:YigZ family protein [Saprospiraceae bacterium]
MAYTTVKKEGQAIYKARNSKFYGYAFEVNSEEEAKEKMERVASLHHKARHLCYAYRIGQGDVLFRINDDGEPSGSAGRPIYNQILSAELDNILVVVVRYFGGVKLGIPGLIEAYGKAAELAVSNGDRKEVIPKTKIRVQSNYALMGKLMEVLKSIDELQILDSDFESGIDLVVSVETGKEEENIQLIKTKIADVPFEMDREIELKGLTVRILGPETS